MAIRDEIIEELFSKVSNPEELLGKDGILKQLTARLLKKAMKAEMTEHLGYEAQERRPAGVTNARNGTSSKTLQTESGPVTIQVPRDRHGTFEPQIVRKGQRRFAGFDDKILALYARGMTYPFRQLRSFADAGGARRSRRGGNSAWRESHLESALRFGASA